MVANDYAPYKSTIDTDKVIIRERLEESEYMINYIEDKATWIVEDLLELNIRNLKEVAVVDSGRWGSILSIVDENGKTYCLRLNQYGGLTMVHEGDMHGKVIYYSE